MFNDRVETGTLDLSELAQHWQLLDAAYDAVRHVTAKRRPGLLHARMIDEGQVAGHRVYMAAQRYLMIARDNHQALVALLQSPHGLSVSAPWNLLRGTFEASFYAAWVLDPEESLERRRRALRLEIADEREQDLYYDDLLKVFGEDLEADPAAAKQDFDQAARDVDTTYRAEAQELGLTYPPPGPKVLHGLAESVMRYRDGTRCARVQSGLAWVVRAGARSRRRLSARVGQVLAPNRGKAASRRC
ncbi:hypothetical protein G5V59_20030 [Nocardioides sp. W3-2-3]|uniref:hypothetical protein n=1 Tax=Nocardioides convexus TaxID=2712224 RepID=UPI0024187AAF|nr:hypothetical protein [Nocardioides convexus]NHA01355.1 hypothetical protein [Nocardioides convexus]